MAEEIRKQCGTCKYAYLGPGYEPCKSCGDDCSKWESDSDGIIPMPVDMRFSTITEKNYVYFVSYFYISDRRQQGVGNCKVERTRKLRTMDDVTEIANDIQIRYNFDGITILNWKELEG